MLENLRDKIINVQQDISASFRSLASGQGQQYKNKKHDYFKGISLNAGGDILHHYQKQWEELHTYDAENAKKAEEVDSLIENLHTYCQQQLSAVKQLNVQLCALPQLQATIMELMGKIGELEGVFEEVEDALLNLEDTIEAQELQERQLDHRFQLAMYKEKRLADFENYKAKLAQEHALKVTEVEKKRQAVLKERSQAFQEVFEQEVKIFKTQGIKKLKERMSSTSSAEYSVSLEDIDLNDEAKDLEEFLGKEEELASSEKEANSGKESEESSGPEPLQQEKASENLDS